MATDTQSDLSGYHLSAAAADFLAAPEYAHYIDGAVVSSADGATLPVYDPSSGGLVGVMASGSAEDVDRAVAAARRSFDEGTWRNLAPMERERRLRRFVALLLEHADTLADIDAVDAGMLRKITGPTVQFAADYSEYFSGWPTKLSGSVPPAPPGFSVSVVREPIGVVGYILPWNGPTAAAVLPMVALAAGNSVVYKPAEQAPISAVLVAQLLTEAGVPDGVYNVVQGLGESVGAALTVHPGVDKISFTGSIETGRRIQAATASTLKRLTLELGGKSPNIVFADANLEEAVPGSVLALFANSGQVCTAGSRLLVERSIRDEFVEGMVNIVNALRVGLAFDDDADIGPLVSAQQLERVSSYVGFGRDQGADVAIGGERAHADAYLWQPTVFTGVDPSMRIAQEEIFGPVLSVIDFEDEAEAFRLANATEFGLASGVWTNDLNRANRAARELRSGITWINCYGPQDPAVPFGGVKQSGHGKTFGEESILGYTQTRSIWTRLG